MFIHAFTSLALLLSSLAQPVQTAEEEIAVYQSYSDFAPYLNKKTDTTYVINFWATWCKPCIQELPSFEQLSKKYKDQKVKVILVSLDFSEKLEKSVKPFIRKKRLKSTVMILDDPDADAWIEKVDKKWSGAIPATVIYNKNKRSFYEKKFEGNELEEAFLNIHRHD